MGCLEFLCNGYMSLGGAILLPEFYKVGTFSGGEVES
jgi:hypothetical protein